LSSPPSTVSPLSIGSLSDPLQPSPRGRGRLVLPVQPPAAGMLPAEPSFGSPLHAPRGRSRLLPTGTSSVSAPVSPSPGLDGSSAAGPISGPLPLTPPGSVWPPPGFTTPSLSVSLPTAPVVEVQWIPSTRTTPPVNSVMCWTLPDGRLWIPQGFMSGPMETTVSIPLDIFRFRSGS